MTVGVGGSFSSRPGHPSDESSRAYSVGHGGDVTGLLRLVYFIFDIVYIYDGCSNQTWSCDEVFRE